MPPPLERAHPTGPAARGARGEAREQEFRRGGARRGGRQGAREGAGVARPAAGVGRQAQVARLLVAAALAACANQGEPPGGPPHTVPPQVVRVVPESGAVLPDLKGDAVIQFDEVIDEMPGSGGGGGGRRGGGGRGGAGAGAAGPVDPWAARGW